MFYYLLGASIAVVTGAYAIPKYVNKCIFYPNKNVSQYLTPCPNKTGTTSVMIMHSDFN